MNKALVLAAFLGLAASKSVGNWFYPDPTEDPDNDGILVDSDMFYLDYLVEADFGYGSHYAGSEPESTTGMYSTSYGVHGYSYGRATVSMELLNFFMASHELELEPAYAAPYTHTVWWVDPRNDMGIDFMLGMTGGWEWSLLDLTLTCTKNWKTFEVSLVDYLRDDRDSLTPKDGDSEDDMMFEGGDWTYDEDYELEFEDPFMTLNLIEEFELADKSGDSDTWFEKTIIDMSDDSAVVDPTA